MEESNLITTEDIKDRTEEEQLETKDEAIDSGAMGDTETIDVSQNLFPESPVYEPEDEGPYCIENEDESSSEEKSRNKCMEITADTIPIQTKRKIGSDSEDSISKILKLEADGDLKTSTQTLDNEVSEITASAVKRKLAQDSIAYPSTSRVRTPVRSSPRKVTKRSNSSTDVTKTPKTPRSRPASADITRTTPRKQTKTNFRKELSSISNVDIPTVDINSDSSNSRPSVEFISEIPPTKARPVCEPIVEEYGINDSQSFHLNLSESPDESEDKPNVDCNSDPVIVKDRSEILKGEVHETRSEGYSHTDPNSNLTQPIKQKDFKERTTDQESTDSVCSISDSPDMMPSVASKLISKLSNGNSSTPTEQIADSTIISLSDSDGTPDMIKLNRSKGKRSKSDTFRASNTTTPSTISPLPNGHSLPTNTPHIPTFDIYLNNNEEGDFLTLYVVRTDNDLGMDMMKEYQRFSKRFTMDSADVSATNSSSSVTSLGMINLANRASFSSTITSTSTSSSNRTSDGAFVVPQPPRKSVTNPGISTVKGYDGLIKKLQEIISPHIRETNDDPYHADDKISIGVQASPLSNSSHSNGNASPEEVSNYDKTTPKSSLKKNRVRGRRHIAGKTKRAILPTQIEEPEYMHDINSPEMISTNGENGKTSPVKSPTEDKSANLLATPKSVNKLKQKRSRPTSPRPATPVEKAVVKQEYPGYPPNTAVLGRWVDKRYYSGRVIEIIEPNKYFIKFDDGQNKVLLDDFIVFGTTKCLPLEGQSVYAVVNEENIYEPVLVLGVEENDKGTVTYRCTTDGDTTVCVTASELYLTEDQAKSIKDSVRPKSPSSAPNTPRRRGLRELDLDNIIQGPRSARTRDKGGNSSGRKRVTSPKSPKASTSGLKPKTVQTSRKRLASESSELSESSNSAPPARLDDVAAVEGVAGVEPEVQRTPRKIDGVKAGPLQLKGAAKQNIGKKNSKLTKFENDEVTNLSLGPIAPRDSKLFENLHFLLTCTNTPKKTRHEKVPEDSAKTSSAATQTEMPGTSHETKHYSSEEDGETTTTLAGTDSEELQFSNRPFNKERLKEQLEAGGGTVYSHFDDVPKSKYSMCKLIAPRHCLTAKYILCLAADIRALSHDWVIMSCIKNSLQDYDKYVLPAGMSTIKERLINWTSVHGKRNASLLKDKTILLCGERDTFVKFWERVCSLCGAATRVIDADVTHTAHSQLELAGAAALITEWDCPHEVQNKANQDAVPLVSTHWLVQCLVEGRFIPTSGHDKFSFMYSESE